MTQNTIFGQNIHELFSCRLSSALLFAPERVSVFKEGLKSVLLCIPLFSWPLADVLYLYRNENRKLHTFDEHNLRNAYIANAKSRPTQLSKQE